MAPGSVVRFAGLALLWGSNFLFIKVALEGLSPAQIVASRMALGAVVLVGALPFYRLALPRGWALWGHLAVAAAVGNLLPYSLFAWAEQHVPSNVAGAVVATTPLFTLALALILRLERLTARRAVGLLIGFGGVLLLLAPWEAASPGSLAGQMASLGAALGYAVVFVYLARFVSGRGLPPLALAAAQLLAGTALLVLAAPAIASGPITLTARVAWSAFLLGTFGTGAAYLLNYRLLTDEGATTTSLVVYLLPLVAVVLGVLLLDEPLTSNVVAGAATILVGVAISSAGPYTPMRSAMRRRWSDDVPSSAAPDRARRR